MKSVIIEAWCSPFRSDIYEQTIISLDTDTTHYYDVDISEYMGDHFISDHFNNTEELGLWKVVFRLDISHCHDSYWSEYDTEYKFTPIFKAKMNSWSEVKDRWLELTGRYEEYYASRTIQ